MRPADASWEREESIIVEVVLRVGERVIDFGLRLRLCVTCHCCFDFDFDSITDRLAIIAVVEVGEVVAQTELVVFNLVETETELSFIFVP